MLGHDEEPHLNDKQCSCGLRLRTTSVLMRFCYVDLTRGGYSGWEKYWTWCLSEVAKRWLDSEPVEEVGLQGPVDGISAWAIR